MNENTEGKLDNKITLPEINIKESIGTACFMTDAQRTLGLTYEQFKTLGLEPSEIVQNPHSENGKAYLFQSKAIELLIDDPRVVAMREKRTHKEISTEQRMAKSEERFQKKLEAHKKRLSMMNVKISWSDKAPNWSWREKAWIGLITKWESGKQEFKWGVADYRKGIFKIEAKAGDIVRYGHKDTDAGTKESRYALVIDDAGATQSISPEEALRIWNDSHGKQSEENMPLKANSPAKISPIQAGIVESNDWDNL